MHEKLKAKVESIAENYADLVDKRIKTAQRAEVIRGDVMAEINDGIRMLNHVAATLERIDRLSRGYGTSGQE